MPTVDEVLAPSLELRLTGVVDPDDRIVIWFALATVQFDPADAPPEVIALEPATEPDEQGWVAVEAAELRVVVVRELTAAVLDALDEQSSDFVALGEIVAASDVLTADALLIDGLTFAPGFRTPLIIRTLRDRLAVAFPTCVSMATLALPELTDADDDPLNQERLAGIVDEVDLYSAAGFTEIGQGVVISILH